MEISLLGRCLPVLGLFFKTSGLANIAQKWVKEKLPEFLSGIYQFST